MAGLEGAEAAAADGAGDAGKPSELNIFVDWLNREGFHAAVLEYLPDPRPIRDPGSFFARQVALIAMGNPAEARDATFQPNPLSLAQNLVSRAYAHAALKEPQKVELALTQAVGSVQIKETYWLEQILARAGAVDLIVQMYEALEKQLAFPLLAQVQLLPYYYGLKREHDLMRIARSVSMDRLSGSLAQQFSMLYFLDLYRADLLPVRRHIEGMVSEYPRFIEPRVLLAFTYTLSGELPLAQELIQGWEAFELQNDRKFAIMLAFIHIQLGEIERARELVGDIPVESLLDRERVLLSRVI